MSAAWVRGLFGLVVCLSLPSVVRADVGLVWPSCEPAWWEREAVQRIVAVELRASGAAERRGELRFVIEAPCEEVHEVGLEWRDDEGLARRTVDLRDVPAAARARAIALAVAGLVAGPRVVEASSDVSTDSSPDGPNEASSDVSPDAPGPNAAAPTDASSSESPSALPPPVPDEAAEASATDEDASTVGEGARSEAAEPEDAEPEDADEGPNEEAFRTRERRASARGRWQLGATLDGAWSTSATPWLGGALLAGWTQGPLVLDMRVGVRFGREHFALGTLVGRWGGVLWRVGADWTRGPLRLGARLGGGVDSIVLFGRSDTAPSARRLRRSPIVELVGRVAVGRRARAVVELGAVLPLLGLRATAPDGAIEVRHVVGVLRVGVDFDVVR